MRTSRAARSVARTAARTAAVLVATTAAATALAGPAAAAGAADPHEAHDSRAHCMGRAISSGAVHGEPGAVAEHHRALKAALAADGLTLGQVWRTVASLPTCE